MYPPKPSISPSVTGVVLLLVAVVFATSNSLAESEVTPRQTPVFVVCPEIVQGGHCEILSAQVRAELSNRRHFQRRIRYHLVAGPGEVDSVTGVWSLDGGSLGPGNHIEMVEIAASWRKESTVGDENCRFEVRVIDYPPEFTCNVSSHFEIPAPGVSAIELQVSDSDDCDSVAFGSLNVRPEPHGEIAYDVRSGLLIFDAEEADAGRVFTVTVRVQSGDHGYSGRVYLHTQPIDPIVLSLGRAEGNAGDTVEVPLIVESAAQFFDYADLLIQYDWDRLRFIGAEEEPAFFGSDGCQWFRFEAREALIRGVPGKFISLRAQARERRQDSQEPCILPDVLPAELCRLKFEIKEKYASSDEVMPVRFFWSTCLSNVLMDRYQYVRRVSRQVFDWDGSPMEGDIDPPSLFGLSDSCYSCNLSGERMRAVEFHNGSVRVSPPEPIVVRIGIDNGEDGNGVWKGDYAEVDIDVMSSGYEFGAFDLLVTYNNGDFNLDRVTPGDLITECEWEYFTYRHSGINRIRLHGVAETNNGNGHPLCISPGSYPANLARLRFLVTTGYINPGSYSLICIHSADCDDNTFRTIHYDTVYYVNELLQVVPGEIARVPTDFTDSCATVSPYPGHKAITFMCGGVQFRDEALDVGDDGEAEMPESFALEQNYPNPFNNETVIRFSLPIRSPVELVVYNVLGEVVFQRDGEYPAGVHQVAWPGGDTSGEPVASGVYYYRLTAGEYISTRKMVLLK